MYNWILITRYISCGGLCIQAIGYNCRQLESINLGWCEGVGDAGVKSLAYGCPDLRALDLCGCVLITDESVIALANNCLHLRTLGLYYCQNITDRAMYALAYSRIENKKEVWESVRRRYKEEEEEGLINLNISQCTALTPPAVQALCDSFPALHTCPGRHSLIISGCLNLTSVHCACALTRAHWPFSALLLVWINRVYTLLLILSTIINVCRYHGCWDFSIVWKYFIEPFRSITSLYLFWFSEKCG